MQTIVLILVLAITVEALIQYSKTIIEMLEKNSTKLSPRSWRRF